MGKVVYSATILDHFRNPRHTGDIEDADLIGQANNPVCGDRIRITIRLTAGGTIGEAKFVAEACAICTASASVLMDRIQAMPLAEAAGLHGTELVDALGGRIPAERTQCATLPLEALRAARKRAPPQQ